MPRKIIGDISEGPSSSLGSGGPDSQSLTHPDWNESPPSGKGPPPPIPVRDSSALSPSSSTATLTDCPPVTPDRTSARSSHRAPVHTGLRQRSSPPSSSTTSSLTQRLDLLDANPPSEFYESDVSTHTVPIQTSALDPGANHILPVHTELRSSVLSYENSKVSYKGMMNLALLLLFVTNVRLVVENYMKYGFLISIPGQYVPPQDWVFTLIASALLPVNILVALGVERVVADYYAYPLLRTLQRTSSYRPDEQTYRCWTVWSGWIHAANITVTLAFPSYVVYQKMYHPLLGMAIVFTVVIQSLKLISYALVNRCLRYDLVHGIPQPAEYTVHYPANIRLRDSLYFFWVPTLCYQPSYPRNQRFRKSFFLKRCLEGAIATVMIYFLVEQYAIPTLKNSITPWEQLNVPQILERVFKLSTTSVLIWLLGFYAFFHAFLNALAELLHFGDRSFYLPWWNSGTLARYWRLWNQPVHFFFKRHVYIPCLQAGFSPHTSMVLIFFISALLHELVVGIPTHNLRGHAFWGIFFQVPLVLFTDLLAQYTGKDSSIGNIFFWISFCILGQPFLVVRYFYDWTKQYLVV